MSDKVPSCGGIPIALYLIGFNKSERDKIILSCARMAARGRPVDTTALVGWLVDEGAIATLGLLSGRRGLR
jgi:hypothetical protein